MTARRVTAPGAVYLASANAGKVRELAGLLGLGDLLLAPPAGFTLPPEDGATYEENALDKARALARATGASAIGDDSGLEVDALGGRPGPRSARSAPSDRERIERLLGELRGMPAERRTARFVCVLALVRPDGREEVVRGECRGRIAEAPRGTGGFGYDPIFVPEGFGGRTFAEVEAGEKAAGSHRGRAARALKSLFRPGLANPY